MDRFCETRMGRVHWQEWGSGVPLVLMHGNGGSGHEFARNAKALARDHRVIAWDMPGQGDSDPMTRHMRMEDHADALADMLAAAGVERAIVGGSSVGAVIAADFAARYPARTLGALLIELAARPEAWFAEHWSMVEAMFSIPTQDAAIVASRFVSPTDEGRVRRWNVDRHKAGGKAMMDVMWAGREYDLEAALPKIAAPTLLVFGDKSPVLNRAEEFRGMIPDAELVVLQGAGHFPMVDVPGAFERAVLEFATAQIEGEKA